jgi:hypothetical protein
MRPSISLDALASRCRHGLAAAALLSAIGHAQVITEIPGLSVPHTVIDMDQAGPSGPTSILALRAASAPCTTTLTNLSFTGTGGVDFYDVLSIRGRGLGWNGNGLVLLDAPNDAFLCARGRIDLSILATEIGLALGDHAGTIDLEFYRGANLLATHSTGGWNTPAPRFFRMSGNSFDRVEISSPANDGWVLPELHLESAVQVSELPFMPGLHSVIDMDAVGNAGTTSLVALNAAGSPMPATLRGIALSPAGRVTTTYDTNTTQGRALARNTSGQLVLVNPPSGTYLPFRAELSLVPSNAFGISIGDWSGAFAIEFWSGPTLLATQLTTAFTSAAPKFFLMTGASFDRVIVRPLDASATWVIPALYLQVGANECCDALPLRAGANGPFDSSSATTSAPAWPCGAGGKDLWFHYTAPCAGNVRIETCGLAGFDTVLQAFTGPCGNLVSIACNDDACGVQSALLFPVQQGQRFLVRVGGFGGASGAFSLDVTETTSGNGSFTHLGSACGAATLSALGIPDLGGSVSFLVGNAQGAPFVCVGLTPLALPLCPAGCVLGVLPDIGCFPGGSFGAAIPCDPLLVGGQIYVQGLDLGASGGCASGAPAELTLTQTIRTTIG